MGMTREERADLRRRIREGREHLRRRLREELGRVDFRALRAQARAAKEAGVAQGAGQGPALSREQVQEAQRRLTQLKRENP